MREALSIYREALPAGHWFLGVAECNLGTCLANQRRFADAEPLLLQACESLAPPGTSSDHVLRVRERLGELYDRWGKPQQATTWRSK